GPAGKAVVGSGNSHGRRDVGKGAVAVVVEELRGPIQVVEEQVGIAVVVEVDPGGALAGAAVALYSRPGSHLLESAVPLVAIQAVWLPLATNEEVEEAIIVEVGPSRGDRVDGIEQPGFPRDVGEGPIAVVP